MAIAATISELELQGGAPCFDFINSGVENDPGVIVERLNDYEDVLTLITRLDLLPRSTVSRLRVLARTGTSRLAKTMTEIREARQLMHVVFSAITSGTVARLDEGVVAAFNKGIGAALVSRRFIAGGSGFAEGWDETSSGLRLALYVFQFSAWQTLRDHDPSLIRKCDGCEWLFLDTSKSHRRKWCNMQSCGSLVKSRRYYERKTGGRSKGKTA